MTDCIALFGAGGAVGHALADALDAAGHPYREVGRSREFKADFFTGEGVREAAEGADTIFYLAGAPYTEFFRHPIMVRNALDAAQAAGTKRFIHIAPVYSYGYARRLPVSEEQPHEPHTKKGRRRLEQEQAVLERNSGSLQTMVVHLPDFYGPYADAGYANAFVREALAGKTASWIGPSQAEREFIYVPDAATPLLRLADTGDAYGRCWNLGGTVVKAGDFINGVFTALDRPPKFRTVPKAMLQVFGLFVPFMREVAEMYYLSASGFVLDDSALRSKIGAYAKTPLDAGIRETISWMRSHEANVQ